MRNLGKFSLGALLAVSATAGAQEFSILPPAPRQYRMAAGASFNYGLPVGDFHDYVKQGWGLDGFFRWNVDPQGVVSLRVEGGFLEYGRETKRVPFSETIPRIRVDLTTSNDVVWLGLGPQLTIPSRFFRPYANATGGFSYFFTESRIEGTNNDEEIASTTNYHDGTWSWGVGAGFLVPFHTRAGEVSLDFGARYHGNGEVRYLRRGSIEDLPGGQLLLHPIQSEANLVTYRLGVSVAIR